ncbi:sirtuin [Mycena crocata]|nr:sirtuin [Mycena crocata]
MTEDAVLSSFQKALACSKNIIIVTGAGLSAASGVLHINLGPFDETKLAKPETFKEDPSRVWQFITSAAKQTLSRIVPALDPEWPAPLPISRQNMDALCSRVLWSFSEADKTAAEKCIIETRCTSCAHVRRAYTPTPCSAALDNAARDAAPAAIDIPIDQLPRCGGPGCTTSRYGRCGGLLRPGVVWFGERMNWCDLLLLVGTSTTVYPAAGFAKTVKERGGKVAVFNLEPTRGDAAVEADFTFVGPCTETLPPALAV